MFDPCQPENTRCCSVDVKTNASASPLFARRGLNLTPPPSPMSKRPANRSIPPEQRKRRRNGISMSSEVLEPPKPTRPPPSTADTMRIWHTNIEQASARVSHVPLPKTSKSQPQESAEKTIRFEEILESPNSPPIVAARYERKKRNDSVSLFLKKCLLYCACP